MEIDFIKNDKNVNIEDIHKIVEHLYKDYLLIKRLIYKLSNQFRSHKQFKLLIQIRKNIECLLSLKQINYTKNNEAIIESSHILHIFFDNKINFIQDLTVRLGCMIKEMMQLKLHIPYCIIVLGITSRLNFLLSFLKENKEKLIKLFKSPDPKQIIINQDTLNYENSNSNSENIATSSSNVNLENKCCEHNILSNRRNERYFEFSKEIESTLGEDHKNKEMEDILHMSLSKQRLMLNKVIENTNESFLSKKRINIKNL